MGNGGEGGAVEFEGWPCRKKVGSRVSHLIRESDDR